MNELTIACFVYHEKREFSKTFFGTTPRRDTWRTIHYFFYESHQESVKTPLLMCRLTQSKNLEALIFLQRFDF
jgi:hypothetical protein